jgi:hypothetical protein
MEKTGKVRTKFQVVRISHNSDGSRTVGLEAACDGSAENASLFSRKPVGGILLTAISSEVVVPFEIGRMVYVDFSPVN